jgi:hypothetical protein
MNIGVFFTCYTENEAVEYSLNLLKKVYPDIPVYLVSDGGSNFNYLESSISNLKTKLESDSRGILMGLKNTLDEKDKVIDSIKIFLRRIKDSIDFCSTEYILIMESDVLVRGEITIPNGSVLLGTKINPWIYKENDVNNIIIKYGGIPVKGYGCTPVIFKSDIFMKAYELIEKNPKLIDELCEVTYQVAMYDILLPIVFALVGYSEQFNPEIVECFRNHNWENTNHPLVHQFRRFYPKNNYDGIHSGESF